MKSELKTVVIVVLVFIAGYYLESLSKNTDFLENFDVLTEIFAVFVSFSIFAVTWYAYNKGRDNHTLFLGMVFLVTGLFDLFHVLSYPFMPDFITANSHQKSIIFWVGARVISAMFFFASVYVYKDTLPKLFNKNVLFISAITISFLSFIEILFYPEYLPLLEYPDGSPTALRNYQVAITAIIILYASYLYSKRIKKTGERNFTFLIYGFIIATLSDLIYFNFELTGHLLKITAFYYIFISLYETSVALPYEKLALAEEKLRHAAEESLRVTKEKLESFIENSSDAITIIDMDGKFLLVNRAFESIYGWTQKETVGLKLPMVPEDLKPEAEKMLLEVKSGRVINGFETKRQRKDGSLLDVSLTVSPIRDAAGNITAYAGTSRDITEHKKAEEICLQNEKLAYAERLKSEFFAVMGHELRTPMNAIIGFSELLMQTKGKLEEKQVNYVNNIQTGGKQLSIIIENILELAKTGMEAMELSVEKIQVNRIINDTNDLIKDKAAKRNVILKTEFDPLLSLIEADRQKLKVVLYNLLDNAVKFSKPEGGTLTIATKKEDGMAKFSISDTGIGIKEEDMGKLFLSLQQIDMGLTRKYGGTGAGLAISKKVVELHGGKIWAESKYGVGSTFIFLIPIKSEKRELKDFTSSIS